MRYQRKCAKIIINRHYFRHKSEIDSDNQMILYYNMVEAAGVEYEADVTTIGVYAILPNVYRIAYFFMFGAHN